MATLLISAAVNIAVGLALNALFPPPDIVQEGPRLNDLGFTSAAFGKPINIIFGTDRVDGNIIDNTDPAIEEIVSESTTEGGKGGGQSVTNRTYSYFLTCRVAFGIEGASDLIRMWADGKVIYDASSGGQIVKAGLDLVFYPGGSTQSRDPEEIVRRGINIPAYRHLTSVKLNRLPLADFGNRIPNFTAEIAMESIVNNPVLALDEPSTFSPPSAGAADAYMLYNPFRDEVYGFKGGSNSIWSATGADFLFKSDLGGATAGLVPTIGLDGFAYRQASASNSAPVEKVDVDTGAVVESIGITSVSTGDNGTNRWENAGWWAQLSFSLPGYGEQSILCHLAAIAGPSNGSLVDANLFDIHNGGTINANIAVLSDSLGFPAHDFVATPIPDHDRARFFVFSRNNGGSGTLQLMKITFTTVLSNITFRPEHTATFEVLREFTQGSGGDEFEGGNTPEGWAINRATGDLILSNGDNMVLYNPDTDTILASRQDVGFRGRNNYFNGNTFAFTVNSDSTLYVIDTRDLSTIRAIPTSTIAWPGSPNTVTYDPSNVWEDRTQALYLSRVAAGSNAVADGRVLKIFINRVNGEGVPLDFVVEKISTTYNRLRMAGLETTDFSLGALAGDIVLGYTLNSGGSFRSALEPLRQRFFFDLFQSDWLIKASKRGGLPILTVPEEDVGLLKRGRDLTDEPPVQEVRIDELSLPMRLNVRYKNKDIDYNVDMEHDKRHLFPSPTMRSRKELTLDLPLVDQPTPIKRMAQQWLFTTWDERRSFKTVIPWTYLKLDPSDVFNLGLFGETHVLRLAEQDVGHGLALDINAIVQDTKQFSSTIVAGANSGFVSPNVPSGLPTRLIPLDAPLLSLQDFLFVPVSNAYMAFSAFEDTWPGANVFKSANNVDFQPTASANREVVLGKIKTAPGEWGFDDVGEFANRFQEVVEGGTMVVTTLRGASNWVSATEENVLNGANLALAVRASDGQIEAFQFQDVTVNDDNTVTLERLLRGRLGTEDIADLGLLAGDTVVLLTNSTGSNTISVPAVQKQNLAVAELNNALFFRGVTIATLLEDTASISKTYTGRDLKPYSVTPLDITLDAGDVILDWERRTRGPLAGEWEDLVGTVPINELIEQYEATITDCANSVTKVVNDETNVTFLSSELTSIGSPRYAFVQQISGVSPAIKSPALVFNVDTGLVGITPSILDFESTVASSGTSVVVTKPTGTVESHLMIAFGAVDDGAAATPPLGWTEIWSEVHSSGLNATAYAWYKVAGPSEPANYTFTLGASEAHIFAIVTIQCADEDDPINASNTGFSISNTTTHIAPSITTTVDRCLLLGQAVGGFGGFTYTPPTEMTELFDLDTGGGAAGQIMSVAYEEFPDAGVTGTRTFTPSAAIHYAAGLLAIKPKRLP